MRKYEIAGLWFSTKQSIAKQAQDILKKSDPGKVLLGEDRDFILGLIKCHPKATDKIGVGIKHIIARIDPVWKKGKQFLIIRHDGSNIDFSYKKCIYGEMSKMDLFRCACRTAVVKDIVAFRIKHIDGGAVCPYFGYQLNRGNAHVDHVKPKTLNWLVDEFITRNGIDMESAEITGDTQKRFFNPILSEKFRKFHNDMATLELVSERANQTCCKVSWKESIPEYTSTIEVIKETSGGYQEHENLKRRQQG